jgi:hypothetical protein
MRIAEAGVARENTWDERQNFRKREGFFPKSAGDWSPAKKSLHLVMIQLLCYPIRAMRSPKVRALTSCRI